MARIVDAYLTRLEGEPGFWRGVRNDVPVFVFSDDRRDRMRIMAPIGVVDEPDADLFHVLLQANFGRAVDARYAMRGKEIWAVVVHPLATLAPDDLPSLFDQVVNLVRNTGTTFASTDEMDPQTLPDDIVLEPAEDEDDDDPSFTIADREDDDEDDDDLDDDDEDDDEDEDDGRDGRPGGPKGR
ncbi:MAG: type III secretion system chaperone [bacterium]